MFYDFLTKYTDIFVEKMKEAFALQKLFTFFQQKNIGKFEILTFEILTSLVFEQPGPEELSR